MASYRIIALTVSSAVFMQFLDATALNTAIPTIARDFHIPATDLNVAVLSYQLSMAALIPAGAALGDRIGPRRAFVVALAVFLFGSMLCALSHSLLALTAARAVQGLGGAAMMPISRLLVIRSADRGELVSALNWLLIPGIVGPLLGPAFGGLIVAYASWHWIFLINVPIALLGMVLTVLFVPKIDASPGRFDFKGLLFVGPAIVLTIFGLEGLARPASTPHALLLIGAGIALGLLYVRHARTTETPAIDLTLLRIGSFRHSMLAGTILRTAIGAMGLLWPLWFQLGLGLPPALAGSVLTMSAAGALASRFAATSLLRLASPRRLAIGGATGFLLLTLATSAWLRPGVSVIWFYPWIAVFGFLPAVALSVIGAAAYVEIEAERAGAASGFYVLVQQLSLSLGVTSGVWAIGASRWISHGSLHDNSTYTLAGLLVAGLIISGIFATTNLDEEVTAVLRPKGRET